jgi:hypothetical protein
VPEVIEPAHLWIPPRQGSYADEAIDLAAICGRELDAEQQVAVDAMLSYGPGGRWAALETCRLEPRQNGKTGGELVPVVLFDLFLMPPDKIVWTAHLFRTARDAFNDFDRMIASTAELSKRVKKVSYANGEEAVELHNGARLEFLARSKGGGRGIGGKRVVMDEALFLSSEAMGALLPTLAARSVTGDPQINYASSAGVLGSDHLRTLRDRGRKGGDPSLVYVEHCAPGGWDAPGCELGPECPHTPDTDGCVLDDESLWKLANPALGRRIALSYIRAERRALPPEEFGRERLGWHTEPAGLGGIPLERWSACADEASKPTSRPVFMIDASPGLRSVAIVACMYRPDGFPHVEVVAHGVGHDWAAPRAAQLQRHRPIDWIIDPGGPAGALLPDLQAHGLEPRQMSARDLGQACEAFAAAVNEKGVRHLDDPALNRAVASAGRREIGDGLWAWSRRKSESDISPLVAATGAYWGLSVSPPPKPPPAKAQVESPGRANSSDSNPFAFAGF